MELIIVNDVLHVTSTCFISSQTNLQLSVSSFWEVQLPKDMLYTDHKAPAQVSGSGEGVNRMNYFERLLF